MNFTKKQPLGDYVLVKVQDTTEQITESNIFLPDSVTNNSCKFADVIEVGPGLYSQSGIPIPMRVSQGDVVVIPAYSQGTEIKINGESLMLLRESEILMIVSEETAL